MYKPYNEEDVRYILQNGHKMEILAEVFATHNGKSLGTIKGMARISDGDIVAINYDTRHIPNNYKWQIKPTAMRTIINGVKASN